MFVKPFIYFGQWLIITCNSVLCSIVKLLNIGFLLAYQVNTNIFLSVAEQAHCSHIMFMYTLSVQVISKEKATTHTYYEIYMREGQTLCNLSSAEDEKSKVKEEMEQYHRRWLHVVTLHSSLDRDCQDLKLQFQTFLDSMLALAVWLYSTWSSLMSDEERPLQVTSTGTGEGPGDQWSAVKAAEDGLSLQKCKITSLQKDGSIWVRLPLLHESYSERFVKVFVEEVSMTQHTSLLLFQDGISVLQQKFADLEQLIAILKLIHDASHTLDTILRWITNQETHYGTSLSVAPTQDTHTGRHHLEELKVMCPLILYTYTPCAQVYHPTCTIYNT